MYNTVKKYILQQNAQKYWSSSDKNPSASGGLRPPDPLLGLRPWIPLGDSVPQTPCQLTPPDFKTWMRLCTELFNVMSRRRREQVNASQLTSTQSSASVSLGRSYANDTRSRNRYRNGTGTRKPVPVSGASYVQFGTDFFFWYQFSVTTNE